MSKVLLVSGFLPSGRRGTAPSCSVGLGGRVGRGAQQRKPQVGQGGVGGPRVGTLMPPQVAQAAAGKGAVGTAVGLLASVGAGMSRQVDELG